MRGENQRKPLNYAATIVDDQGTPRYHILPSKLVTIGLLSMALLLIIAAILGFLVIHNKLDIDRLDNRIQIEENKGQ